MELYFPAVLDGAMGTELVKRGFAGGGCAESWSLEHPEAVLDIQRGYVEAGSDIIYTPTFGANRVKLEANGIFTECATITSASPRSQRRPRTDARSSPAISRRRGFSSRRWAR